MERRALLKRVALGAGALVVAGGAVVAGWLTWLASVPKNPFRRVARLSDIEKGKPLKVTVLADPAAEGTPKAKPIGRVFLLRGDQDALVAYSARCPHAGGWIDYDGKYYVCSKHGATFDGKCHRVATDLDGHANPAPRDMDTLEVRRATDAKTNEVIVEVNYIDFVVGRSDRTPLPSTS
jgi:nitrite reductase/ring-hydroxylating ferredoxin subunit